MLHQLGLQGDLLHARQGLGNRAVALGVLGLLQEQPLVNPRNLGLRAQVDAADGVPLPLAPEAYPSFGVDALRGVAVRRGTSCLTLPSSL